MELLLVSATTMEIRPFLNHLTLTEVVDDQHTAYRFRDIHVDVLIPGVGMVPTAYYLGSQLARKRYDLAINAGISGAFDRSIRIGSVLNVISDCVPELGAEDQDQFLSIFDLGLADPDRPPYRQGKLVPLMPAWLKPRGRELIDRLPGVAAITSNTIRGNADSILRIRKLAPAVIEGMEGAAFFYACLLTGTPCLQIRSVSNFVEERDKSKWNLDLALKNLNRTLHDFIIACTA